MTPHRFLGLALVAVSTAIAAEPPAAPTPDEVRAMSLPPTVAPDAKVTQLASGFMFTEGAATAPNGDVYFVDQPNNKILKWDVTAGALTTFLHPSGYANGQYFDAKGNLISCADEKNELWSITPDGQHTVLLSSFEGKLLDGPNDVWVRPDGGIYITDPIYRRTWWDQSVTRPSQPVRAVYFFNPRDKSIKRVAEMTMPNGIIGTPDGKTLYVADINARKTWGYDIQADGTLTHTRLVCNFGSDGMTIDNRGNLYLSANIGGGPGGGKGKGPAAAPGTPPPPPPVRGVSVVDTKTGRMIGFIPVAEQPANLCFGGKNHDTLYITARTGFYSIPTKVKGANPAK